MNIAEMMKFGPNVMLNQLEEAYEIAKNGRCDSNFLLELEELIDYARYVPNRSYRYEIGRLLSEYYSGVTAMMDRTFMDMHKVLFGEIFASPFEGNHINEKYVNELEQKAKLIKQIRDNEK